MRRHLAFAFLLLAALRLHAAPNPAPVNLDFESGAPGEVPPGWISPSVRFGYTGVLSAEKPKQGKQSVRLSGPSANPEGGRGFGNVMQTIDAKPYRGKRIRFRGAVRVEGEEATGLLWMRVDLPRQQTGFFDNMQDRPIHAGPWRYYEISGDVDEDAEDVNIGMMLQGSGVTWLDDVTIEIVPKLVMRAGPPRAVTPRGLENLIAFTRLFGIVRHFHASDEAAAADWEAVAVNGIDVVEGAPDAPALAARLREVFLPLAPSAQIYPITDPPKARAGKPSGEAIVAWEHTGFGKTANKEESVYYSERVRHDAAKPDPRFPDPLKPLQLDLGGGVAASIPLAVYANATRTLPVPTVKALPHSTNAFTGNDRATRLGAVVILWNVLQHFYPYFDVVDVDWRAELRTALRAAGEDRDQAAFVRTLRHMVASIDDGHGNVYHPSVPWRIPLPVLWHVAGDAAVVAAVEPTVTGLSVGDEVVAIDGQPVLQTLSKDEALISGATPQWRRHVALRQLGAGDADTQAALTVRNADGSTRIVTLKRTRSMEMLREKRPEKIAELKPGLWYIDLDRIDDETFDAALPKLAKARGIVFDLRGYPSTGSKPIRHLIDSTTQSARWNVPVVRRPDFDGVEWNTGGRWSLEPLQPRLTKNIVFVTDGRAISYAESWMGIVEAHKLGEIVGETTAGTNGNVNMLKLPGGYRIAFTGMKVLKHDGSRHHGIGIVPTIPVTPTTAGLRAGRDEQLEKAIEVLEKKAADAGSR
jgi:C-terminal processing protease CtpA/Prc